MRFMPTAESAGALHAIEVVIADWRGSPRVLRYDPMSHRLEPLRIAQQVSLRQFAKTCAAILPDAAGTALALIGDERRMEALYEHPSSLLWRDAGGAFGRVERETASGAGLGPRHLRRSPPHG